MFGTHCNVATNVFVSHIVLWTGCESLTPLAVPAENGVGSGEGGSGGHREDVLPPCWAQEPHGRSPHMGLLQCQIPGVPWPQFPCSQTGLRNCLI